MPSPALPSFTVLGSLWFLVVLSWKQFIHPASCSVPVALPTHPSVSPPSFPQDVHCWRGRGPSGPDHLSYSAWHSPSLTFLSVAWSHSISPCFFGHCGTQPSLPRNAVLAQRLTWAAVWCSDPAFSPRQLSHMPQLWWGEGPVNCISATQGAFQEEVHLLSHTILLLLLDLS